MKNSASASGLKINVLRGILQLYRACVADIKREKPNSYDIFFHLMFVFYAVNYLTYLRTGQMFFGAEISITPQIYFVESNTTAFMLLAGGVLIAIKQILYGLTLRLGLELMVFGSLLVAALKIDETGGVTCMLIVTYSLTRLIQMAGTAKVSG